MATQKGYLPNGEDAAIVAALDVEYQQAVKNNDVATMARILADDMVLVTGSGTVYTRADLLSEAREQTMAYERQDASNRTVRLWGNAAVVTALLWAKGTELGVPFDYKVWFSDTYIRIDGGWRYAFGQSSLRMPVDAK